MSNRISRRGLLASATFVLATSTTCGTFRAPSTRADEHRIIWFDALDDTGLDTDPPWESDSSPPSDWFYGGVISLNRGQYGVFFGSASHRSPMRFSFDGGANWNTQPGLPYAESGAAVLGTLAVLVGPEGGIHTVGGQENFVEATVDWGDFAGEPVKPDLHSAAHLGSGRFVAVGDSGAVLFSDYFSTPESQPGFYAIDTSLDPSPLAPPSEGLLEDVDWNEVAETAHGVVMVGDGGAILYLPTQGTEWVSVDPPSAFADRDLQGVVADSPSSFVVVGNGGAIFRCQEDEADWDCAEPQDDPGVSDDLFGVDADQRMIVAVGSNGIVLSVPVGEDWAAPAIAWKEWHYEDDGGSVEANVTLLDVEATDFQYVAVGGQTGGAHPGGLILRGTMQLQDECSAYLEPARNLWADAESPACGVTTSSPDTTDASVRIPFDQCFSSPWSGTYDGGPVTFGDLVLDFAGGSVGLDTAGDSDPGQPGVIYTTDSPSFVADQFTATWTSASAGPHQTTITVLNERYEGVYCGLRGGEPVLCRNPADGQDPAALPAFASGPLLGMADLFTGATVGHPNTGPDPLEVLTSVSRFRSKPGSGHRFVDDVERYASGFRRATYSMAHTFTFGGPGGDFPSGIPVHAPMAGYVRLTGPREGGAVDGYGPHNALLFVDANGTAGGADLGLVFQFDGLELDCDFDASAGKVWVAKGAVIGHVEIGNSLDVAMWENWQSVQGYPAGRTDLWNLDSYLGALPSELYAPYAQWGFGPRALTNDCNPVVGALDRNRWELDETGEYVDPPSGEDPIRELIEPGCMSHSTGRPQISLDVTVAGELVTVDLSGSTDDEGVVSWTVDWGDGETPDSGGASTLTTPTSHNYDLSGGTWFTLTATVSDRHANVSTARKVIHVGHDLLQYWVSAPDPTGDFADDYAFLIEDLDENGLLVQACNGEPCDFGDDIVNLGLVFGQVVDIEGTPINEAVISIADHPEWGETTIHDGYGRFDMLVVGGQTRTVDVRAPGYTRVQRTVFVPIHGHVSIDTVALVPEAPAAPPVLIDGSLEHATIVSGPTVIADDNCDGTDCGVGWYPLTRQPNLFLPAGLVASAGGDVLDGSWTFHMTEFTRGPNGLAAMPGELPDGVLYTYALDLRIEEAGDEGVSFEFPDESTPMFYVDNFHGFPVGETVPFGTWSYDESRWVPSRNGHVVAIRAPRYDYFGAKARIQIAFGVDDPDVLSFEVPEEREILESGRCVLVDGRCDRTPSSSAEPDVVFPPFTEDEVRQLAITYSERLAAIGGDDPSIELWRVPILHLTPGDLNWPGGPPAGAGSPPVPDGDPTGGDDGAPNPDDPPPEDDWCKQFSGGSLVLCESQTLGETIEMAGIPVTLNYRSDRVPNNEIRVPLVNGTPHPDLLRVEVQVEIAGQKQKATYTRAEAISAGEWVFAWDGRDGFGRTVVANQLATVTTTYVYQATFYNSRQDMEASFGAFGEPGEVTISEVSVNRRESAVRIGSTWRKWLDRPSAGGRIGGLWTVSGHHTYDRQRAVLSLGSGDSSTALFRDLEDVDVEDISLLDGAEPEAARLRRLASTWFGYTDSFDAPQELWVDSSLGLMVSSVNSSWTLPPEPAGRFGIASTSSCSPAEKLRNPYLREWLSEHPQPSLPLSSVSACRAWVVRAEASMSSSPVAVTSSTVSSATDPCHDDGGAAPDWCDLNGRYASDVSLTAPTALAADLRGSIYVASFYKLLRLDPVDRVDPDTNEVGPDWQVFELAVVRRPFTDRNDSTPRVLGGCTGYSGGPCFAGVRDLAALADGTILIIDDQGRLDRLRNGGLVDRDLLETSVEALVPGASDDDWPRIQAVDVSVRDGTSTAVIALQYFPDASSENHDAGYDPDWGTVAGPVAVGLVARYDGGIFSIVAGSITPTDGTQLCEDGGGYWPYDVYAPPRAVAFDLTYGNFDWAGYRPSGPDTDFVVSAKSMAVGFDDGGRILVSVPVQCSEETADYAVYRIDPAVQPDKIAAPDDVYAVPSRDGDLAYIFVGDRHVQTRDVRTDTVQLTFTYGDDVGYPCSPYVGHELCAITDVDGETTSFVRDSSGAVVEIVGPHGHAAILDYDVETGFLTSVTDVSGDAWSMEYDNLGLLGRFEQPAGQVNTFCYDGRLLTYDIRADVADCSDGEPTIPVGAWYKQYVRSGLSPTDASLDADWAPDLRDHRIRGHKVRVLYATTADDPGLPQYEYEIVTGVDAEGRAITIRRNRDSSVMIAIGGNDRSSVSLDSNGNLARVESAPHPFWGWSAAYSRRTVLMLADGGFGWVDGDGAPVLQSSPIDIASLHVHVSTTTRELAWDEGDGLWTDTRTSTVESVLGTGNQVETRTTVNTLQPGSTSGTWLATTTSPSGRETWSKYDSHLRLIATSSPDWPASATSGHRNVADGSVSYVSGSGNVASTTRTGATTPETRTVAYTFYGTGAWEAAVRKVTDRAGNGVEYDEYNARLQPTVVDLSPNGASGDEYGFAWGDQGFLDAITMPSGGVHDYDHDAFGRLTSYEAPEVDATPYSDDESIAAYDYDSMDRLLGVTLTREWDDGTTHTASTEITTSWDLAIDQPDAVTVDPSDGPALDVAFCFDVLGRVTDVVQDSTSCPEDPSEAPGVSLVYTYSRLTGLRERLSLDPDVFLPSDTDVDVVGFDYRHDAWLRPAFEAFCSDVEAGIARVDCLSLDRTFDDDGLVTAIAVNGGSGADISLVRGVASGDAPAIVGMDIGPTHTTTDVNSVGELVSFATQVDDGGGWAEETLQYDVGGRIASLTDDLDLPTDTTTTTRDFDYDSRGRLVSVREDDGTDVVWTCYTYDDDGNRTGTYRREGSVSQPCDEEERETVWTAEYDARDRLLWRDDDTSARTEFRYDGQGNRVLELRPDGTKLEYEWYPGNKLREVRLKSDTDALVARITYVLNVYGQTVGRVFRYMDGAVEETASFDRFVYGPNLRPVARLDEDGDLVQGYVYGSRRNAPDVVLNYAGDGSGDIESTWRVVHDHLGTPLAMFDVAGIEEPVRSAVLADAWGAAPSGGWFDFDVLPFGHAGGFRDPITGLVQHGARWYDPTVGAWISPDPTGQEGGLNLYSYVDGDPINSFDPEGEAITDWEDYIEYVQALAEMFSAMEMYEAAVMHHCPKLVLDLLYEAILQARRTLARLAVSRAASEAGSGCNKPGCTCFAPGTLVLMADGTTKPIEEVAPGDWVLAAAPGTFHEPRQVVETYQTYTERLVAIGIADAAGFSYGVIRSTGSHAFWTGNGWRHAIDLIPGDILTTPDGTAAHVVSVAIEPGYSPTFNFQVDGLHTYFVVTGGVAVLVHNAGPNPFLPGDPYSPESVDTRISQGRRERGFDPTPDRPLPPSGPGRDMGGHAARGRTPHTSGERNVNSGEEHSRVAKGQGGRGPRGRGGCP